MIIPNKAHRFAWSDSIHGAALAAVFSVALMACCQAGAGPWPGESWEEAVDLTQLNPSGWASNLSGACWNSQTRRLWVCSNGPARFWSLTEDGAGGFLLEREYTGTGDLEGITQADADGDQVFVIDEQARTLRAYRVSDGTALNTWFLSDIPAWGNSGPEGIAFIPDAWLASSGFTGGGGQPYPQSVHGANGFGGILLVAVQTSGWVYAFDLRDDGTHTLVGRYLTSRAESCELAFDASIGRLYILHNIDGNWLEVSDLTSMLSGADRKLATVAEIQVPSGSNIEGFALTPALTPAKLAGDGWCFFTDDSNAVGALRWFSLLPSTLSKEAGDGQLAVSGTAVAIPPSVKVRDAYGNPLPDFLVTFSVTSGDGTVTGVEAVTDHAGVATVGSWTLGLAAGTNTLAASGAGLGGSPQEFVATGVPRLPAADASSRAVLALAMVVLSRRRLAGRTRKQVEVFTRPE